MNIKERLALIQIVIHLQTICDRLSKERNLTIDYSDISFELGGIQFELEKTES
jgi:hypothetical protein